LSEHKTLSISWSHYHLAIMYHYGEGRPVDLRQALDLYRKVQSSGTRDVSQEIRETEDLL
ncbi:TPA: SEL1-like repeat protein, partial [Escherichia coli]